ncbi:MAG: group 1 truncated hemoglobin [Bdellovibrionales bacterium]|nr:group 1 truncated hemoglobin [Bdellovibrionales bacterium]
MKAYDLLPDKNIVQKVNDIFYDKVYDHPWLSQYFSAVTKEIISKQQTAFIIGAIGGPKNFSGRIPAQAHPHMFITNELFDLRKSLLIQSLEEAKAPEALREAWLKIDESFRGVIVKKSTTDCSPRWSTDPILNFPNPRSSYKKAG